MSARRRTNALVGHLPKEWTCWSSPWAGWKENWVEARKRSSYMLFDLARIKEFSVPQLDMEGGSLNILVTLTAMADFYKRRHYQQGNGVWTSRKVGQGRSNQSFSSVSGRIHAWSSKKMPASSVSSKARQCQPREDLKGTKTAVPPLYSW